MTDQTIDYFLRLGLLNTEDSSLLLWAHGANSRERLTAALTGPCHMIEADVLMRGSEPKEPIMAHPPMTDSDIRLQEWLEEVRTADRNKGIKLDFKSVPVWLNADILPGPGGKAAPLDARAFLEAAGCGASPVVLSLGWTSGWSAETDNPGYSWDMVREMEELCRVQVHPITFPVRAALLSRSFPQIQWLLQQSDRYTLTVWTGPEDVFTVQDLLAYRRHFEKSLIYYDLPDSQRLQLCLA
ncbi:hypothetical protein NHX12_029149 [Muraenolepis orangiensis]|uniref:Menorin-like domain-containing protein n=1 Tax=Muraenolepis orangiensis TaxID=630683 RepID=A0A9Q0IND4_9TELE|nr:hypothetical protein NHX12_029149 [Muraenolepis orangiensis]